MAQGFLVAGVASTLLAQHIQEEQETGFAMTYPANAGTSNSIIFARIVEMEHLINYYIEKTKPSRAAGAFSDSRAYILAAEQAASILKNLEVVRDLRIRREQEGILAQAAGSAKSLAPPYEF